MQQMGVLLLVSCSNGTLGLHLVTQMRSSLRNHLLQEIVQVTHLQSAFLTYSRHQLQVEKVVVLPLYFPFSSPPSWSRGCWRTRRGWGRSRRSSKKLKKNWNFIVNLTALLVSLPCSLQLYNLQDIWNVHEHTQLLLYTTPCIHFSKCDINFDFNIPLKICPFHHQISFTFPLEEL